MVNEFIPSQKGLKEIELDGDHITEIYIDAEYFRPKFEDIIFNFFTDDKLPDHDDYARFISIKMTKKLIDCLKNPENNGTK